nr:nephrin-like [Cherax quadricarinatus]
MSPIHLTFIEIKSMYPSCQHHQFLSPSAASSRRTYLSLQVVVPPGQPILRVGSQRATGGVVGPLQEGASLAITCSVAGGQPPPDLVWMTQDEVLDATEESRSSGITVNQLNLLRLSRTFHNAILTCYASNSNVTTPTSASLTVTMNLRPLVTKVEAPIKGLRVGREYDMRCDSAGSRPHPNMTWTLGTTPAAHTLLATTEHGVNISTSRVRLTASRRHHGQRLTCTAVNPLFPASPVSDTILLNVTYPPVATMELGRGVAPVVKEGEDVYFNCNVDANPPTYRISWYRLDKAIVHSPEAGVVLSGNSLALRGVTRHQAGPYVCSASNVEGDTHSPPLILSVNYAPVCAEVTGAGARVYATGLGQFINVSCEVLASPASVKYSWVFNNSITSQRLSGEQVLTTAGLFLLRFTTQGPGFNAGAGENVRAASLTPVALVRQAVNRYLGRGTDGGSVVQFVARTHQDYGTLQCWAQNVVGRMTEPCLFHVVPAGRPERPVGCSVVNKTYDSLVVACKPGFDGGLQQSFVAKVFEEVTGRSQVNVSSKWPTFILEGLTPGLDYIIQVVARNVLGSSDPVNWKLLPTRWLRTECSAIKQKPEKYDRITFRDTGAIRLQQSNRDNRTSGEINLVRFSTRELKSLGDMIMTYKILRKLDRVDKIAIAIREAWNWFTGAQLGTEDRDSSNGVMIDFEPKRKLSYLMT